MAWTCTSHAEPSPTPTGYATASCIRLEEGSSWLDQDMVPVDEVSYCWCESYGGDVDYLVGNPREDWNYWLRTVGDMPGNRSQKLLSSNCLFSHLYRFIYFNINVFLPTCFLFATVKYDNLSRCTVVRGSTLTLLVSQYWG
ncbi:unnamed protein product [Heterobilharzia americana]|nr:unnamed protein product [Heterobilharzia americana]